MILHHTREFRSECSLLHHASISGVVIVSDYLANVHGPVLCVPGESIGQLVGSDCDTVPPFNQLEYFICENTTALSGEYFDIRSNGELFVRKSLVADGQNTVRYTVSIRLF